jgi:2,4-dienoyl-CoA reductase-like NADH-dependent reductase (Old Yellow Enzyme family)
MNLPLGKSTRIKTAREVLHDVLARIPDDFQIGLRLYGYRYGSRRKETCTDSQLVIPVQPNTRAGILTGRRWSGRASATSGAAGSRWNAERPSGRGGTSGPHVSLDRTGGTSVPQVKAGLQSRNARFSRCALAQKMLRSVDCPLDAEERTR